MPLIRTGRSLRLAGADQETSLLGGTLWGFATIWATSFALASILGDQTPTRADGGIWAPANLAFFLVIETLTGGVGGLVALRSESRAAAFRLALVVLIAGAVISVLASGTPNVPVSGTLLFVRSALHAVGVATVAWMASGTRNGERGQLS
jgi:hypothetical protein